MPLGISIEMSHHDWKQRLGPPALTVAGLQLWVHGRESHDAAGGPEDDWLRVTVHCGAEGASVWASGSLLMLGDIERFGRGCTALSDGEVERVTLSPFEPELRATLERSDARGHVEVVVELTPDQLSQQHRMSFEIDLTYLPGIASQCAVIVAQHAVEDGRARSDG